MHKLISALLFLSGCSSITPVLDPRVYYRRDMRLEVNGSKSTGALVVSHSDDYNIEIEAKGNLDLFTFTTCHREETRENAGKGGIFGNKKRVKINYQPVKGIETEYCPIFLGGYEVKRGRHSWGFLDFEDPDTTLKGVLKCNGKVSEGTVTVCQAREGLIQELGFAEEVTVRPKAGCEIGKTSGKVFRYKMNPRECVYAFKSGYDEVHRHTSIGYEEILIRED